MSTTQPNSQSSTVKGPEDAFALNEKTEEQKNLERQEQERIKKEQKEAFKANREQLLKTAQEATQTVDTLATTTKGKVGENQAAQIDGDTEKAKNAIEAVEISTADKVLAAEDKELAEKEAIRQKNLISKSEFDQFVNTGKVSDELLDKVAQNIKNGTVTPQDIQIHDHFSKEIEKRLREYKTNESGNKEISQENKTSQEQTKTAVQEAVADKEKENEDAAEKTAEELANGDPKKKEGFFNFLKTKTKDWWKNASTMQKVIAVGGIGGSLAIAGVFGGAAAVAGSGLSILGTKIGKAYLDRERTKETKEKGLAGHIMEWYDKQPEGKKRVLSILAMTTAGATLSVAGGGLAGFVGAGKSMGLDAVSHALLTRIGRGVASGFSGEATRKVAEKAFGGKLEDKIKSIEARFAQGEITEEEKSKLVKSAQRNFAIRDAVARMAGAFAGGYAYGHATEWGHNIGEKVFHHDENGADNTDPKPIGGGGAEDAPVNTPQYESKYLPTIEVHDGEGGLSVAKRMHELVMNTYAGVDESRIPPEYLKIIKMSPRELAEAFDFYRPGHEAESMMFNKGAAISFGQDNTGHFNVQLSNVRDIDGQLDNQWLFKEDGSGTIDGTDEERVLGREMGLGGADNERYFDANSKPKIDHGDLDNKPIDKTDLEDTIGTSTNEDELIGKTDPNETIGTSVNEDNLIGKTDPKETIESISSKGPQTLETTKTDPQDLLDKHVSENNKEVKAGITNMETGQFVNKYPNAASGSGFQPPISMYHETKDYANAIGQGQYQDQHRYDNITYSNNTVSGQTLEGLTQSAEIPPSANDFYYQYLENNTPGIEEGESLHDYLKRMHPFWSEDKINDESQSLIDKAAKYAKKAMKSLDPVAAQRKAKAGGFFGNLFGNLFGGNNSGNNGYNNQPKTGFGDGGWGYGQSNQNGGYYNDGSSQPNMMKPG